MKSKEQLQSELNMYERQLSSMGTTVRKDVQWQRGVQDQINNEVIEYVEYSNPTKAKELRQKIEELKKNINGYDNNIQKQHEEDIRIGVQKAKETKQDIFNLSKQKYDEKMNAYMSMNFWGKAKTMLAGKKPKKMNNREIVATYGNESVEELLQPTLEKIELLRQDEIRNITELYSNMSEEEKMRREKELGTTLESRIKQINFHYDKEIEDIRKNYDSKLNNMVERGISL